MDRNDALLARLKAVECADATAPVAAPALIMSRAKGSLIYDVEGREYIDLCAGFGVLALGHNSAALARVFARHASLDGEAPPIVHAMGDVYASDAKVELLEELVRLMPAGLERAALALTGAQAVEIAVKTAMLATKKSGFIVFEGGYHGLDLGLLPLTTRADFRAPFNEFLPQGHVATLPFRCDEQALERAIADMQKSCGGVAAMLVEPVQGRAGVRAAGHAWLSLLRRVCDRHGVLLIYDEVFTGLGRTGRWTFASEIPCDLLCLGKALGGGLPLSACVGTRRAMDAWPESTGEALHTGTFFGHPLSCALAHATLKEIAATDLPARSKNLGEKLLKNLRERFASHPAVREIRGEGLMLAIEFHQSGHGALLMDRLRARGVVALVSGERGQTLSITPSLTIPESLVETAFARVVEALAESPFR